MQHPSDRGAVPPMVDRRTALRTLGAAAVATAASPLLPAVASHAGSGAPAIGIDWAGSGRRNRTTPTLQVVVNALIRRGSPIHDNVYAALRALRAEYVRFVPWFPYPQLGVAELDAPSGD